MITVSCSPKQHTFTSKSLKKKLVKNTLSTGVCVTGYYFLTHTPNIGVSSLIGSFSSVAYVQLLSNYVENIENTRVQKQIVVPVSMILAETVWNNYNPSFELDFLTTLVGFFSYKLALFYILIEILKDDILTSGEK